MINKKAYRTLHQVRPDDVDMFRHVHSSRYMDYVLAARYVQMRDFYGFPMEGFLSSGLGWVIDECNLQFKRPLFLGESFWVETQIEDIFKKSVRVSFSILKSPSEKISCTGWFNYTLVQLNDGRAVEIPSWVIEKYAIKEE